MKEAPILSVSCCGAGVDSWWWGGWDPRRLWTPRFAPASWSRRSAGGALLALRVVVMLYELISMIISAVESTGYYLATLSVQGAWLCVAYFLCVTCASAAVWVRPSLATTLPPGAVAARAWTGLLQATQAIFAIVVAFEPFIVAVFWVALANDEWAKPVMRQFINFQYHAMGLIFVWLDLLLCSMALPDRHILIVCSAIIICLAINIIVTRATGVPVYPIAIGTWTSAGVSIGTIVLSVAAGVTLYFIGAAMVALRDRLASSRCCAAPAADGSAKASDGSAGQEDAWEAAYPRRFSDDPAPLPCRSCCVAGGAAPAASHAASSNEAAALAGAPKAPSTVPPV